LQLFGFPVVASLFAKKPVPAVDPSDQLRFRQAQAKLFRAMLLPITLIADAFLSDERRDPHIPVNRFSPTTGGHIS
jgi:hypothetical protein